MNSIAKDYQIFIKSLSLFKEFKKIEKNMPPAQSIVTIRQELQKMLTNDDLLAALKLCKELLPENNEKAGLVLAIQLRLQQLNKERLKGLISSEEFARRIAIISDDLIQLIRGLVEADFEASQHLGANSNAQLGSVLYRVPHSMPLGKASICTIRVAIDEDAILEDIIVDDDVRLRERIEISERMSAELVDTEGRVFDILPLNAKDQRVRSTSYTQWLFRVTPLVEGEHQLLVKVSLLEFDQNTREYVPRDVSVLETVTVVTAMRASDEEEMPLKSTGHSFVIGPDVMVKVDKKLTSKKVSKSTISAFLLALLIFTAGTTFAFTPRITLDWWLASFKDTWSSYDSFIDEYLEATPGGVDNILVEKAFYYKAESSGKLMDLREYEELYGENGLFIGAVLEKIAYIEWKEVKSIEKKPSVYRINKYFTDFPDATRLSQIMKVILLRIPASQRRELLARIESAYVISIEKRPTVRKLQQYNQDFPDLREVEKIIKAINNKPRLISKLKPVLEDIIINRMRKLKNKTEFNRFMRALEILGGKKSTAKAKAIITIKSFEQPTILKKGSKPKLINKSFAYKQPEIPLPTALEEKPKDSIAYVMAVDSAEQERVRQALNDKIAQDRINRENQEKIEQLRLAKEAEEKAEKERLAQEANNQAEMEAGKDPFRNQMVKVTGGTFKMGAPVTDVNAPITEKPQHEVTLSDFSISKYEVTQAQWRSVMAKDPKYLAFKNCNQCPVESVSWNEVQEFIIALNKKTGLKYRLPTEAEWEYAARGGSSNQSYNYSGGDSLLLVGWFQSNAKEKTQPVGKKDSNILGLYDMSGNVYEWCQDKFGNYSASKTTDPTGDPLGTTRVIRGGGITSPNSKGNGKNSEDTDNDCRVTYRFRYMPTVRKAYLGFRLAQ